MSIEARIAETYTLPSHGAIYEEDVNPDIILSSMKTKHEMLRLSATTNANKVMAEILDDCIEGDMGISSYDLCLGDYQFLLYKLRTVTFGPEYEMNGTCPYCGSVNYLSVNLDDLEVKEYSDELAEKMIVHLPESDCDVTLTLQTPRILDKINRLVQDRKRRTKTSSSENSLMLFTITESITEVDEEPINKFTIDEWVKELPMKDTNILLNRINEINNMIGVQTDVGDICTTCGRYYDAPFQINGTFFRPRD